nr:ABC transporter ATP-binding protein [uncultured Brevundimonas sp.]
MIHPVMEFLGGLAIVAVILYGGQQVIHGGKDPGSFFAFVTALLLAYEPVKRLAKLNANLQEGLAAAERVFRLLDLRPQVRESPSAQPLAIAGGALRFADVSFSYGQDEALALDQIDLVAQAGQTIALVGPSGAGKSTILNLISTVFTMSPPGGSRSTARISPI